MGCSRRGFLAAGASAAYGGLAWADVPDVIATSKPSIVVAGYFRPTDNPRFKFYGTGFVVGDGNLCVTNAHVVPETAPEAQPAILLPQADGAQMRLARIVNLVKEHDLALLRFEGPPLPALPLAQSEDIREGLSVLFIGFPIGSALGFKPVTHRAMISSVTPIVSPAANSRQLSGQAIAQLRRGSFDILQLDGTAYPGNSGGPVLDANTGRVVGVINMGLVKGAKESALTAPSGISYALPVQLVRELMKGR